ncbi:DUF2232 domain-containing protein [Paenibacillus barcinonensis]|uniref:DUF2232 domain-containing protein n=1 Tax=Paenibacillus barcinonensis TaxID=198119 RepID=A0ABX6Q6L8_PAEBA|nr:DUF2232 domain-containing protein [Paenibacillus barcinonensis]QKS57814.1 DUF2232 domain-containing protein [Paenibacillus barcinonensis]
MKFSFKTAVWSVAWLLLLLSLLTPLSVLSIFFMMVPGVILYASLSVKSFIWHILPVAVVLAVVHPIYLLFMLVFILPAIVMGNAYKKQKSALFTLMTGGGTMLAEYLLLLLVGSLIFHFDLSSYIKDVVQLTIEPLTNSSSQMINGFVWTPEMTEDVAKQTQLMIPFALVVTSMVMAFITHVIARPILSVMGMNVPKLPPAREWRMPRSLIWYYFLALIIEVVSRQSDGTYWKMIAMNMSPLINLGFMIQAIGFFFFLSHLKRWNPVIPYLLGAAVFFIGPLRIVGIIDLAFPLREAISKSKR